MVEITNSGPQLITDEKKKLDEISYSLEDSDAPKKEKLEGDQDVPKKKEKTVGKDEEKPQDKEKEKKDKGKEKEKERKDKGKDKEVDYEISRGRRAEVPLREKEAAMGKEEQRREKQAAFFEKMTQEAKARYSSDGGKKAVAQVVHKKAESYKKPSDMPIETKPGTVRNLVRWIFLSFFFFPFRTFFSSFCHQGSCRCEEGNCDLAHLWICSPLPRLHDQKVSQVSFIITLKSKK